MEYKKGTMFTPLAKHIFNQNIKPLEEGYTLNDIYHTKYAYYKGITLKQLQVLVLEFVEGYEDEKRRSKIVTRDANGKLWDSFGFWGDAKPGDKIVTLGGIVGMYFYTPAGYFILEDYNYSLSVPTQCSNGSLSYFSDTKYLQWCKEEGYGNENKNTIYTYESNIMITSKLPELEDYPDYDYNPINDLNNFTGDFLESSDINKFISENPHVEFVKSERDQIKNKSLYFVGAFYKGKCQFIRFTEFRQCSEKFAKKYNIPYLSYNLLSDIEKEIFLVAKFNNIEIDEVKILTRRRAKDYYNLPSKDCSLYPIIKINNDDKKSYVIRSIYEEIDKESFKRNKRKVILNKTVWAKHDQILDEETRKGVMTIIDVYSYSPNCYDKRKNNYRYFNSIGEN